jgi:hypothetical protein
MSLNADLFDDEPHSSSFQVTVNNLTNNGSITLTIAAPFNYSRLKPKIECHSMYHHGARRTSQLDVLAVVEIAQDDRLVTKVTSTQTGVVQCRTYGTDVGKHTNESDVSVRRTSSSHSLGLRARSDNASVHVVARRHPTRSSLHCQRHVDHRSRRPADSSRLLSVSRDQSTAERRLQQCAARSSRRRQASCAAVRVDRVRSHRFVYSSCCRSFEMLSKQERKASERS